MGYRVWGIGFGYKITIILLIYQILSLLFFHLFETHLGRKIDSVQTQKKLAFTNQSLTKKITQTEPIRFTVHLSMVLLQ